MCIRDSCFFWSVSAIPIQLRVASKKPLVPVLEKLAPCSSTLPPALRKVVRSARSLATVTLEPASSKALIPWQWQCG
eukprot:12813655-Prorocentrum_lima.AAC.1